MKVSVIMPTYNHEDYIAEAIESVLAQEVDFPYELLIGEDDSADGTRDIVRQYAEQNPSIIRPFYNNRENVIYINGKATGRWNFINLMREARGEHIAVLEGDDCWIGVDKLQKQVDYLAAHRSCSIVFNNAWCISIDDTDDRKTYCKNNLVSKGTTGDLLAKNYIPTCTVLYRKNRVDELPNWFKTVPMGDWPLHLINSQYGTADYLPEIKGAYRKHLGGIWSEARNDMQISRKYNLQLYMVINQYFKYAYEADIKSAIINNDFVACLKLLKDRNIQAAYKYFSKYLGAGEALKPVNLYRVLKTVGSELSNRLFYRRKGT